MAKNSKRANSVGGPMFIGCIVLGVGLGLAFDDPAAGSVIGTGAGFIAMALAHLWIKD